MPPAILILFSHVPYPLPSHTHTPSHHRAAIFANGKLQRLVAQMSTQLRVKCKLRITHTHTSYTPHPYHSPPSPPSPPSPCSPPSPPSSPHLTPTLTTLITSLTSLTTLGTLTTLTTSHSPHSPYPHIHRWRFGMLLWEVSSVGDTPFDDIPHRKLTELLKFGETPHKPEECSEWL